jgi:hypothetical protein
MRRTQLLRLEKLVGKERLEQWFGPISSPRRRSYAGRIHTVHLMNWLNSSKKRNGYARVIRLLADVQRLTTIVDPEYICTDWDEHNGLNLPKRGYSHREWRTLFARISNELRRHRVFPELSRFQADGRWIADWRPNTRTEWMRSTIADLRDQPVTVTDAVIEVVRAATNGFIQQVRECKCCHRWFCAVLKTQLFCSLECQRKHYWSSSSWRAHRRAYMRHYRKIKSLPNVK